MPYQEIVLPTFQSEKVTEMQRSELRDFYKWYLQILQSRIALLASAVNETVSFRKWKSDYSPESLSELGQWALGEAHLSEKDCNSRLGFPFDRLTWSRHPTQRTASIGLDIGMYMSQVFLRDNPTLQWQLNLGSKRNIGYGLPQLKGLGRVPYPTISYPVHIICNMAAGLSGKEAFRNSFQAAAAEMRRPAVPAGAIRQAFREGDVDFINKVMGR